MPPSWRCQPPRRSWPSYAGTPRRSPLTENDVRVPAHGVPMRAVGTRRLQSRRRVFGLPALLTTASTNRSSGRDARGYRWFLDPALRRRTRPRKRRLADRLRASPRRRRAAGREELWRRIRGHHPRDRAFPGWVSGDWWWSARRPIGASAPRCTVPWLGATTRPSVGDTQTEDQTDWEAPPPDKVIAHRNLYWAHPTAPGRTTGTVDSKDVDFGGPI